MHKHVEINAEDVTDWNCFHDFFAKKFGFPSFYGRSMDAWIDCMTSLDAPDEGMTTVHVATGDVVVLRIIGVTHLKATHRDIYEALIECSAFVNYRRIERGRPAILALSFH
jgi:RNAse (barnase) inhibitor barstar